MPKYKPEPNKTKKSKVSALKYAVKMDQPNLQTLFNSLYALEQRVNALQQENTSLTQQLNEQQQQIIHAAPEPAGRAQNDFFRIPDPIRTIPSFDGNKKQLSSWLTSARRTLDLFRPLVAAETLAVYEQAIINKIDGKARDTICVSGNPSTFEEVATVLESVYGDRNDIATYQTQLWSLKMQDSLHMHYKRTKEIMVNMKSLAKRNPLYNEHWEAINHFLEQEVLAAFINGLSKPYFGYAQTAQPSDLETAYAFLCRFQNAERTKTQTQTPPEQAQRSYKSFNQEKQHKPFNKPFNQEKKFPNPTPGPSSDRNRITPMEIDTSLRSNQRSKLFNHIAEKDEETSDSEHSEAEVETEEINFQISPYKDTLK